MQVWLDAGPLQRNMSLTIPVSNKMSTDHLYETTYHGGGNGHVTDDVT